jgi:transposase
LADSSWQAKQADGFSLSTFNIDWEQKVMTCPQGETSQYWNEGHNAHGHDIIHVMFKRQACLACSERQRCTKSAADPRTLTIGARPYHEALQQARQRESTEEYKKAYQVRAGVEGTISQAVRVRGMRRSRYVGLAKTQLQHLVTAAALNVVRVGQWLMEKPPAKTRRTAFAALVLQAT